MISKDQNGSWHALGPEETLAGLHTSLESGLPVVEVCARLAVNGPNELLEQGIKSPWTILWEQLTAFLVVVLIVAAGLSIAVGEWKDAVAILVIVVLNALLGLSQEYRAEKAMAALKRLAAPTVRVRREGQTQEIPAQQLVTGDIVLLEAGVYVPADGRLVECVNLRTQESALTGESEAVEKDTSATAADAGLADRRCMAYLGTSVTYGRGAMVVTATGMKTELGRIATMLQEVEREPTPLQLRLDELGKILTYIAVAIIAVVGLLMFFRGEGLKNVFLTAVSMAVAAVPEGLPAVVTISLALGAQRMLKRRVLIRKLTAVETLGSVTAVCSDKTGTLTENRMRVVRIETADGGADLALDPAPQGLSPSLLLAGLALASDAVLTNEEGGEPTALGDPTETALLLAAAAAGLRKPDLDHAFPRVAELPFDAVRKRMTTVHTLGAKPGDGPFSLLYQWASAQSGHLAFTKGSVDGLVLLSTHFLHKGVREPLTPAHIEKLLAVHNAMAAEGIRVLGLACRTVDLVQDGRAEAGMESGLTFIGMAGMLDPVRPEVPEAVRICQQAGILPIMITGDHPLTARHIARELGMGQGEELVTGHDLDAMDDSALQEILPNTGVYARVTPEHKLRIVEALQERGEVVAMTGDGVNDAPALKKANIGVAMGITGTDVSKEASDMVLQDDNFASIVAAVEEGRVIYDNIRRFVRYMLGTNSGELWVMLVSTLIGMPPALLPVQILWMNLVTDGLPALALALEPAERDIMRRPPRRPDESIIGRTMAIQIIWVGLLMAAVTLGAGYYYWKPGDHETWRQTQTVIFCVIVFLQLWNALAIRSFRDSIFRQGFLSNPALFAAVGLMILLQVGVVYVPFMQTFFSTTALPLGQFAVTFLLGTTLFWALELEKFILRRWEARAA